MTGKEAIAMLKRMQEPEAWEPQINQVAFEALNMAIEALEKQMPKKAELDVEDLICPVCGADVEWKRYCEECGQRIDTGEES